MTPSQQNPEPPDPVAGGDRAVPRRAARKQVPLRLDPAVHDALAHWAQDDLRSLNAQIEMLLRQALTRAGRMPAGAGRPARRGRPPREPRTGTGSD